MDEPDPQTGNSVRDLHNNFPNCSLAFIRSNALPDDAYVVDDLAITPLRLSAAERTRSDRQSLGRSDPNLRTCP
jgi:hypothetical protein